MRNAAFCHPVKFPHESFKSFSTDFVRERDRGITGGNLFHRKRRKAVCEKGLNTVVKQSQATNLLVKRSLKYVPKNTVIY